jgi:ubiquinone biosynthesis protein
MATFKEFLNVAQLTVTDKTSGKRSREILAILREYKVSAGMTPQKAVQILEALGPTFVKMGQIASNRSDILPKEYCEALSQLRAGVAPMPFDTVCRLIDESYGHPWQDVFASIEERPLGSASIAQVHKAVLRSNGQTVAVKVRRPSITQQMAEDITLLKHLVALAEFSAPPESKNITLTMDGLVRELERTAAEELDFTSEMNNLVRFRAMTQRDRSVDSPVPYPSHTTDSVLVMEFIDGPSITDPKLGLSSDERARLGEAIAQSYVAQVVDEGFFHADPHPGNILVRAGRACWIDLGMVGTLTPGEKFLVNRLMLAIGMHDSMAVKDALLGLARPDGPVDHGLLLQQVDRLLRSYTNADLASLDVGAIMVDVIEIVRTQNLALPPSITMLGRGLTALEGVLAEVAPQTNVAQILAQHVKSQLGDGETFKNLLRDTAFDAALSTQAATRLPKQASETLDMLERGELRLGMDVQFRTSFRGMVYTVAILLALALLSVGLFLGSCILCTTAMEPRILGVPLLGVLGYLGAAALGVYVVVVAVRMRHRMRNGEDL